MKTIYVLTILFFTVQVFAQNVGIGTNTPDPSAKLHIEDADKGILIPRVTLSSMTSSAPVASPAEGLLVFNINANVGSGKGFYYWDGVQWRSLTNSDDQNLTLNGTTLSIEDGNSVSLNSLANDYDWIVSGSDMYNANAGNIGIGTSNPIANLHLNSGRILFNLTDPNFNSFINLNNSGHNLRIQTNGVAFASFNGDRSVGLGLQGADKVGVGTNNPNEKLHILGGTIKIDDGLNAYTLPSSDGTAGNVITTDGAGNLTWVSQSSGTDDQTLTLNGTNLSIEDGNNVDLSTIINDGDWLMTGSDMYNANFGNVGIGTNLPEVSLDINGALALRETPSSTTTNPISNFAVGSTNESFYTFKGYTSDFRINSIAAGTDGKILILQNATNSKMTILDEFGSIDANKVRTMTGSDLSVDGQGMVTLIYSTDQSRWLVLAVQDEDVPDSDWDFSGGNMYNANSGNIGIGTSTPSNKLHVEGGTSTGIRVNTSGSLSNYSMIVHNSAGRASLFQTGGFVSGYTNNNVAIDARAVGQGATGVFASSDDGVAVVAQGRGSAAALDAWAMGTGLSGYFHGGDVHIADDLGVGDNTPDGKLEVRQTAAADIFNLYDNSLNVFSVLDGGDLWADAVTTFYVDASANEVGIGDDTPDGKLEVRQTATADIFNLYDNTTNVMTVVDGGNVGMGTSIPNSKLHVNNPSTSTSAHFRIQDAGSTVFTVANNGNTALYLNNTPSYKLQLNVNSAAKPTSSSWTVASDARLKTDVTSFEDGLNVLMAINPVWFNYNGDAGMPVDERGVGTIAQELQEIAPYMVNEWTHTIGSLNENNPTEKSDQKVTQKYLGVDYGAMDFIVINSIQEQQKIIKDQQQLIDDQQQKIEQLEALIQKNSQLIDEILKSEN